MAARALSTGIQFLDRMNPESQNFDLALQLWDKCGAEDTGDEQNRELQHGI